MEYGSDHLVLFATFAPNCNYDATAFTSSLNALLTVAGRGLLWLILDEAAVTANVVIQDLQMR